MEKAKNREVFRELFVQAPVAMLAFNSEYEIKAWNLAAAAFFGVGADEALDRKITEFLCPCDPAGFTDWLLRANVTGCCDIAVTGITVEAERIPVRGMLSVLSGQTDAAADLYVLCVMPTAKELDAPQKSDEAQQRADLLNAIVDGEMADSAVAVERGKALGMDLSAQYALFAVSIDEYAGKPFEELQKDQHDMKDLLKKVTRICSAEQDKIVWTRYDGFAVLCPLPEQCRDSKIHSLARAKSGRERIVDGMQGVKLTVGVSSSYHDILDIRRCYREAKEAANVGKRIWGGNDVYHYADLGICQLLTQFQDLGQLRDFVNRSLGKLIKHDEAKKTQLVATLEEILSAPNLKEAAERSFVHHKTILFRKNRIEEILGVSIDDMETRLTLSTAVKILRLL